MRANGPHSRTMSLASLLGLAGCCFPATNTPEPCHEHPAQTQRFDVTGACGAPGVLEITLPAGNVCDLSVPSGAALGLPIDGSMYGAGTGQITAGEWFLGIYPGNGVDYRQCHTTPSGTGLDLVCEDRREGATLREVCRAHLEPVAATP
jgi:hypothetical protein